MPGAGVGGRDVGSGEEANQDDDVTCVGVATMMAPVASPLGTPSPMTKENIEAEKVEATPMPLGKPRLHIAEDAICESCQ